MAPTWTRTLRLAGAERRRIDVRHGNDLGPAVGGAQRGTHAADPYANTE